MEGGQICVHAWIGLQFWWGVGAHFWCKGGFGAEIRCGAKEELVEELQRGVVLGQGGGAHSR